MEGEKIRKKILSEAVFVALLSTAFLFCFTAPSVRGIGRDSTSLSFSPSDFSVRSGGTIELTVTLTSNGEPLEGKPVEFGTTNGSVDPKIDTTNSEGKVTVTYTAPEISGRTSTTVTAHFAQTVQYKSSSATASGTIKVEKLRPATTLTLSPSSFAAESGGSLTLTARLTSNGEPLSGRSIEFLALKGSVTPKTGKTNAEGKISVTYTAPDVESRTLTTVKAQFAGVEYKSSSERATGIISPVGEPPESARLERTPENVYSYHSGIIFAKAENGRSVKLSVEADVNLSSTPVSLTDLGLSDPVSVRYEIPMVPVPQAKGWHVTAIPPLPTKTFEFNALGENIKVLVSSKIKYELYVDGKKMGEEGYRVRKGTIRREMPPLLYTAVSDVLDNPSLIEKTYGLGPKGWTVPGGREKETLTIALDDKGIEGLNDLTFQYKAGQGLWKDGPLTMHPAMELLKRAKDNLNNLVNRIETIIQDYKPSFELKEVPLPGVIAKATIPAQPAGTYVQFRSKATDVDGNTSSSPKGMYYTDRGNSKTNALIVDPDVKSWLIQEDLEQLSKTVRRNSDYRIPPEISNNYKRMERIAQILENYGIVPFHHWEHLGEKYDLYITWPDKDVADLLENRDVIVLSDLWMGVRQMGKEKEGKFWDWDLKDKGVIDDIQKALNENHVGLISTHGTFSDWIVWEGYKEKNHYKIGSRGHVGADYAEDDVSALLSDLNPIEEKTISATHGMPELAVYEYIRDKISYYLCRTGKKSGGTAGAAMYAAGLALGSTPQQIPFVPFGGKMVRTPEGKVSNLELPDEFTIKIPTAYKQIPKADFKSYTGVGWQLAMPRAVAYSALDKAEEAKPKAKKVYDRITKLVENRNENLEADKLKEMVENSLTWALQNQYEMMNNATIRGRTFHFKLNIPGRENAVEKSIKLGKKSFRKLLKLLPVKLVARSEKGLAGIITYDKYFIPRKGYRSVYFSPEMEASPQPVAGKILRNAVEWTQDWEPLQERLLAFLGNVPVSENLKSKFSSKMREIEGKKVIEKGLILNEKGKNVLKISAGSEGELHVLVAHPTSKEINCKVKGRGEVDSKTTIGKITNVTIHVKAEGSIRIELSAEKASSILNPVFSTVIGKNIEKVGEVPKRVVVERPKDLPEKITLQESLSLTIENVKPNIPVDFEIENSKVAGLKITTSRPVDNLKISVEKLKEKPPAIPEPPGLVHAYTRISITKPEASIENAGITFWVPKEWLATHDISKENVSLLRYHEEAWENLPTKLISENASHFKYRAETPGFSTFAITAKKGRAGVADFTVKNLTISDRTLKPSEPTTVSVDVKNTGEAEGSKTVRVMIEGKVADKETVTLSPGGSTTARFSITREKEGTYEVKVGDLTSSFEVVSEGGEGEKPEEGLPLLPIGTAVAVIAAITVIVLYKRR